MFPPTEALHTQSLHTTFLYSFVACSRTHHCTPLSSRCMPPRPPPPRGVHTHPNDMRQQSRPSSSSSGLCSHHDGCCCRCNGCLAACCCCLLCELLQFQLPAVVPHVHHAHQRQACARQGRGSVQVGRTKGPVLGAGSGAVVAVARGEGVVRGEAACSNSNSSQCIMRSPQLLSDATAAASLVHAE